MRKKMVARLVKKNGSPRMGHRVLAANSNNADTITLKTEKGEVKLESLRQQIKKGGGATLFFPGGFY
jgi:5-methyltetrahydrofolate--homocysteine methyltransferase